MEEKTNYNGEYNSFTADNNNSDMPDISGSSYTSDVLSSVTESTSNISSYNYGYSSTSDVLNSSTDANMSTDSVFGSGMNDSSVSDGYNGFDTAAQINSQDTNVVTESYAGSYSTVNNTDAAQTQTSEATYDPTRNTSQAGSTQNNTSSYSYGSSNVSSYSYGGDSSYTDSVNKGSSALGIVSMVFGILSIVCCCSVCIGVIMSIVAVICGIIHLNKKGAGKGFGIAGIITGALGLLLSIVMLVIFIFMPDDSGTDYIFEDDYDYNYDEDYDYDYNYDEVYTEEAVTDYSEYIYGQWLIESGSGTATYVLNEDGTWGWYKDYNDMSDNYYAGSGMTVYSGQEAFDYYGMDASELDHMGTDSDRFFCFQLYVDTYISGGEDKSAQYSADDYFSVALYLDEYDTDSAILVNMDSADQYNVVRMSGASIDSGDDSLIFEEYSMYDGQASIYLPDSWVYVGQQTTEEGTAYEAFGSESGMFEMYVTIQEIGDYFSDSQEMIEYCKEEMDNLFGGENIRDSKVLEDGATTAIFYEAYNSWDDFHYYRSYDIYDGNYYTTIEFYVDEDTMNAGYDVYSSYLDQIYTTFTINN